MPGPRGPCGGSEVTAVTALPTMDAPARDTHRARMPTVLRSGPYRLFFYAGDGGEPAHVHVRRDELEAKFWLNPVGLARNRGFEPHEIWRIEELVLEHGELLRRAWHEYFGR